MSSVLVAGTFAYLHNGHKALLAYAFSLNKHVRVGVASTAYVTTFKQYNLEALSERYEYVKKYLQEHFGDQMYELFTFDTPEGDIITNDSYTDIVVSETTQERAHTINAKRANPCTIHIVPIHFDECSRKPISSKRIAEGAIDSDGKVFFDAQLAQDIIISPKQRSALKNTMWGVLVKENDPIEPDAVAIGDVTSKKLRELQASMFIYDHMVERKRLDASNRFDPPPSFRKISVCNPPGQITRELQLSVIQHFGQKAALEIDGEDDLASFFCILALPLGTHLYYGLPGKGLAHVHVTLFWKRKAYKVLYGNSRL
jgi:pantetheine-phosphate adenylyltransferase